MTEYEQKWQHLYDTIVEDVSPTLAEAKDAGTKYYRNVCKRHGPMLFYTNDNSCPVCVKEARDARKVRYRTDPVKRLHTRARELLGEIRHRCSTNDIPFDIMLEDFRSIYNGEVTHCPIFGEVLDYFSDGKYTQNSASIDRIDATKGYTIDNIAIISYRANRIKNDGTADEHRKIADWMTDHL